MNPLLISGYGVSITVDRACLTVSNTDSNKESYTFRPHQIPYDSIIIEGHYGNISFEAIRWLMKHDILVSVLNWNGNLLSTILPKEPLNGELKIRQYEKYLDKEERVRIASTIIKEKISKSQNMLSELSKYYSEISTNVFQKELKFISKDSLADIMMHEGRIASAYWTELSKVFNKLYPEFHFETRKNHSYSWNMNASDQINALLNYSYALLESVIRKYINAIGLDPSIGFLHEIAKSKMPLVYDIQELFRWISDLSVIQLLEDKKLTKSSFILTENYHIRLRPETSKLLIEKFKLNMNKKYEYRGKQYALETIIFETVRKLANYISGNTKTLDLGSPEFRIEHIDSEMRDKILAMTPEERKAKHINKSTLWYQKKMLKEGKAIKVYVKTREKCFDRP
ncbi:MAG: CRISPR-associated endonuclease Cas1 [Candidatus Micrarchaeia archaeon]